MVLGFSGFRLLGVGRFRALGLRGFVLRAALEAMLSIYSFGAEQPLGSSVEQFSGSLHGIDPPP